MNTTANAHASRKSGKASCLCALLALGFLLLLCRPAAAAPPVAGKSPFVVTFDKAGISSLKRAGDKYDTEYVAPNRVLGHVLVRYRLGENEWKQFSTADTANRWQQLRRGTGRAAQPANAPRENAFTYNPSGWNDFYADLEVTERFRVEDDALYWVIHFRNPTHKPVQLGDVVLPLPFNTEKRYDKEITYTRRLVEHRYISGNASFVYWLRPNGEGPYLVMTPVTACPLWEPTNEERDFTPAKLEYLDFGGVYIHSARAAESPPRAAGTGASRRPATLFHPASPVTAGSPMPSSSAGRTTTTASARSSMKRACSTSTSHPA